MLERRILGDISGRLHGSIFPRRRRVPVRGSATEPDVGRSVGPARSAGLAVRSPLQAALTSRVRTARALLRVREHDVPELSLPLTPVVFRSPARSPQHLAGGLVRRPDQSRGFPAARPSCRDEHEDAEYEDGNCELFAFSHEMTKRRD